MTSRGCRTPRTRRGALACVLAALLAASAAACHHDWDAYLPTGNGGGGGSLASEASSSTGSKGASSSGKGGAASSSSGSTAVGGNTSGICPTTLGGVPLVKVQNADYCVDATETTNEQYASFLSAGPGKLPAGCNWKSDFTPAGAWPAAEADAKKPVVYVDWCDAAAYCGSIGKRLCGRVGGGAAAPAMATNPDASEWFDACSKGGALEYPYGDTYRGATCNGHDYGTSGVVDVGSAKECTGGFQGIYDMSGNAWEWEDACDGSSGEMDMCLARGGAYNNSEQFLGCAAAASLARDAAPLDVGIRCCADAITM